MIIKYGSAVIAEKYASTTEFLDKIDSEEKLGEKYERIIANYEPIKLDKERFYYIRNRSVSAIETWGPNDNGDGFPRIELKANYKTFINSRVSVDHQDDIIVGMVIDSSFIPPKVIVKEGAIYKTGDYVENILAIDKKAAEAFRHDFIQLIDDGKITDTSMGALAGYTICSVPTCLHKAKDPSEYCEHIANFKNSMIRIAGDLEIRAYEICRDVRFFEDSIIVPLELGGMAGGRGADTSAKIVQKIASNNSLRKYIVSLNAIDEDDKNVKVIEKNFEDDDVSGTVERLKKDFKEDFLKNDEVSVEDESGVKSKVFEYIIDLVKKGVPYEEALNKGEEYYKTIKTSAVSLKDFLLDKAEENKKGKNIMVIDVDDTLHVDGNLRLPIINMIEQNMDDVDEIYFITGNDDEQFVEDIINEAFGDTLDKYPYQIFTYQDEDKDVNKIANWKVDIVKAMPDIKEILLFDDNPAIVENFKKNFKNIKVFMPVGPGSKRNRSYNQMPGAGRPGRGMNQRQPGQGYGRNSKGSIRTYEVDL